MYIINPKGADEIQGRLAALDDMHHASRGDDIHDCVVMIYQACGDMMHLLRKYDVAPLRSASDAMFASMCRQAHIIRAANIIRRSQHHLPKANIIKKRTFVGRQKCVFCCERAVKRCVNVSKSSKKVCDFALLTTRQIGICQLFNCLNGVCCSPMVQNLDIGKTCFK